MAEVVRPWEGGSPCRRWAPPFLIVPRSRRLGPPDASAAKDEQTPDRDADHDHDEPEYKDLRTHVAGTRSSFGRDRLGDRRGGRRRGRIVRACARAWGRKPACRSDSARL